MENEFENEGMVFESRTHWYNAQKKFLKKREFWRAVIYALTRPDEYKDGLLKKAEQEKELADIVLKEISEYGKEVGWTHKNKGWDDEM